MIFEKTENGCVELFRGKNKKETQKYEQAHRKTDERIREIVGEIRSDMGRSGGHYNLHRFEGDVNGNGRQIGSKGFQGDTKGSNEHLLSHNSRNENVTDSEVKNSLKLTDSEENELSEEQRKFFENSKVRDEDGNLLVVYHGTDADFTVFDRTKGRSSMDIQGSFFSPWELDASGYGADVKTYYLDIKNPASEGVVMVIVDLPKLS